MLSFNNRFHGHGSLRYVFKNGDTVRSRFFTLRYTGNKHRMVPRFSVSISKKVHKSAVKRNRVRRRVYEIVRHHLGDFDHGFDCVFIVGSPEVLVLTQPELVEAVEKVLGDAGLFAR